MVEGPALEKRYPVKNGIVGSNPTLSARKLRETRPQDVMISRPAGSWRDVRAAEGARLEIVCTAKSGTEGSNPSLSAKKFDRLKSEV